MNDMIFRSGRMLNKTLLALFVLLLTLGITQPVAASAIPTFSIVNVVKDTSVTIQTANFPANQSFTVRMGLFGTLGIGGTVIETFDSGTGGTITRTFNIPASLVGQGMIAIRMDSAAGFYSYNWFYNNAGNVPTPIATSTAGPTPTNNPNPIYYGIPTFSISSVVSGTSVTVQTSSFPANVDFTVRMGAYGTYGVGGTVIETFNSGSGGSFSRTFTIPAALASSATIAIRMDSPTGYYYSYNWFYNTPVTAATNTPVPGVTPTITVTPIPGYIGVPTFSIISVVKDTSVTIRTYNFPPNDTFTARMGLFGTLAAGGTIVGTAPTGTGGVLDLTFNIPASLAGQGMIAIRMDSSTGYYYAYNWFYNVTTY